MSCTVCHQIAADRLGTRESFNGNFVVAPALANGKRRAFGPSNPDSRTTPHHALGHGLRAGAGAAHPRVGALRDLPHAHHGGARIPDGRVIGSLPEQMNYQEWRHSAFVAEQRSCQSCHMPAAAGPVRIASVLGDYRDSLSRHTFVGGNAFMLRMMNRYRADAWDRGDLPRSSRPRRARPCGSSRQDTATIAAGARRPCRAAPSPSTSS